MNIDLKAAAAFMAAHARLLDRRRFQLALGEGDVAGTLAALNAYRNPDGGFGWGLEPDLRSPESQPGAALHAFEVLEAIAPATAPEAVALCDWLESISHPDGGLPFALPVSEPAGTSRWWAEADTSASSIQITAVTAASAYRVARHDPAVAGHPWLARATRYCLDTIKTMDSPHAYELLFAIWFLDAVYETEPEAAGLLSSLGRQIPADGLVRVQGGTENEVMRPLDFAPYAGRPARALFAPEVIEADLQRLADDQREDGGWTVEYEPVSPIGSLEWRGYITVRAVSILRSHSRL